MSGPGAMHAYVAAGSLEMTSPTSRRYMDPRRPCNHGYSIWPSLRLFMMFDLRSPCVQVRLVRNTHEVVEVWSPNCRRAAFVAGLRDPLFPLITPPKLLDRRYDAHLGRFDYSYHAQYWDREAPWWPYMRRVRSVSDGDPALPAFMVLTLVWQDIPGGSRGRLNPTFVAQLAELTVSLDNRMNELHPSDPASPFWMQRPQFPSASEVRSLLGVSSWDEAVDLGVAIQRGVWEEDTWVSMREAMRKLAKVSDEELREYHFPMANESFVGVIVNGMSERNVLRHMAAEVPCFVVHRFPTGESPQSAMGLAPAQNDFLQGTELERLLSDAGNPYQRIARAQGVSDSSGEMNEGMGKSEKGSPEDERPSPQSPTPRIPILGGPFPALPLTREMIDIERVDWIVPPPIRDVTKSGSWEKWELSTANGEPAYVFQGKGKSVEAEYEMYDRRLKRRLFFDDLPDVQGRDVGDVYLAKTSSDWMYSSMEPAHGDPGRRATRPSGHSLPRLDEDPASSRFPCPSAHLLPRLDKDAAPLGPPPPIPGPSSIPPVTRSDPPLGSLKTRETTTTSFSPPVREEYSGGDRGATLAVGGDPRIVVATNLAPEVNTEFFAKLAVLDLQEAGAKLLEAVRTQGRMWLRFGSAQEGQLALQQLLLLTHGTRFGERIIAAFGAIPSFCEAALENNDCWSPPSTVESRTEQRKHSDPAPHRPLRRPLSLEHPLGRLHSVAFPFAALEASSLLAKSLLSPPFSLTAASFLLANSLLLVAVSKTPYPFITCAVSTFAFP
ncbi:hypothetical protein C8J57DRAFT_1529827 [Mycena rebaudengoi]|nr:hypothetical protein C8J57DRAFT_1529827 [Mycena rebaudengoi]